MNLGNRLRKVMGRDGMLGWIDPRVQPSDSPDVQVQMEDGRSLMVPAEFFLEQEDGYYLPLSLEQLKIAENDRAQGGRRQSLMVVPVIAEEVEVDRRRVTTGRVRLHKRVRERQETLQTQRVREHVEVERVPVNHAVEKPPDIRYEGDWMVIPVLEEVLVVVKRLVVREEVRVRKVRQTVRDPQNVTLRSEEIEVQRLRGVDDAQED